MDRQISIKKLSDMRPWYFGSVNQSGVKAVGEIRMKLKGSPSLG